MMRVERDVEGAREDHARHWFARLVRLFPEEFRARHEPGMTQLFDDQMRDAREPRERRRVWHQVFLGALREAPREHLSIFAQDLEVALRAMRSQLGITMAAVGTLALGIGAATAVYGLVHTTLLRPLPFEHEQRLVRLYLSDHGQQPWISLRPDVYRAIRDEGRFFDGIVAQRFTDFSLRGTEGAEQLSGMAVTAGWLEVLGVRPQFGRTFSAEEESTGRSSGVAMISHGLWQRLYGGGRGVLGESLELDDEAFEVIGVLPPGFRYPYANDVWIPLALENETEGLWGLNVQARMRPDTTLESTRGELERMTPRLVKERGLDLGGLQLFAVPTREVLLDDKGGLSLALLLTVGFLLLLVCVNIGNLLLARSVRREREFAVRAALGASRFRQVRQLLTETTVLAVLGGALGLLLARIFGSSLSALLPGRLVNLVDGVELDRSVVGFAIAATAVAGLLFGLAPAWRAAGTRLQGLIKESGRTGRSAHRRRVLGGLVVSELTLAFVLLAGALSAMLYYRGLSQLELGYDPSSLAVAEVSLDAGGYQEAQQRRQVLRRLEQRLAALPGIDSAGATCIFPSREGNFMADIEVEGGTADPEERQMTNHRLVSPAFFGALGLEIIHGRGLHASDREDAEPVVVVSEAFARRYLPGRSAVGRRVRNRRLGDAAEWLTIVGVVADVREFDDIEETWYLPWDQTADQSAAGQAVFALRQTGTRGGRAATGLVEAVRAAVAEIDSRIPVQRVLPVRELHSEQLEQERLGSLLSGAFALFGLVMALLGIGGVTAFAVSERRHEFGLRQALGARRGDIVSGVGTEVAAWLLAGLVLGVTGHLALGRMLGAALPGGESEGSGVLGISGLLVVSLMVAGVAIAASALPALRASRVDPGVVLRDG